MIMHSSDVDLQQQACAGVDAVIASRHDPARWTACSSSQAGVVAGQHRAADLLRARGINNLTWEHDLVFGQVASTARPTDDPNELTARFENLAEVHAALPEASASAVRRAAELQAEAARLCARSRAIRGAVLRVRLPRDPRCGAAGRQALEEYLEGFSDDLVSDAKTVASELINNAYRHGEGAIDLRVRRDERRIRIDVADEGPTGADRVRRGDGGRGLEIVYALSRCWGAYAGSTHVWAELPIGIEQPATASTAGARANKE